MENEVQQATPKLKSRLGFILVAAGCAVGLGNIWRFPYIVGQNGGGVFLLFYLIILVIFGVPVFCVELGIGRKSQRPSIQMYRFVEEHKVKYFDWHGKAAHIGTFVINMFYTVVTAWILIYFFKTIRGEFNDMTSVQIDLTFQTVKETPWTQILGCLAVIVIGFGVCAFGIQKGLERITKYIMLALFILIIALVIVACCLDGAVEGIKFYLVPRFDVIKNAGDFFKILMAALNQCFYSISCGVGMIAMMGSYTDKSHRLLGDAFKITILDTLVAVLAGLIIFPAAASYGLLNPSDPSSFSQFSGPGLLFQIMPRVFGSPNYRPLGQIMGGVFFIFLAFAALSTLFTIYENMISNGKTYIKLKRPWLCLIFGGICFLITIPVILGFKVWKFSIPYIGSNGDFFDLADFLASSFFFPIGALIMVIFAMYKKIGWGHDEWLEEANTGEGIKFPSKLKIYMKYIMPVIILTIFVLGLCFKFTGIDI